MANEWPTVRVEDIAEKIAMGPFGSNIKVETFVEKGVPVISGAHLRGVRLEDGDFNFVTGEHAEKMKNSNVFRGDVIFTHAGNIGQVAYIPSNSQYERYVISQRQFYLRCDLAKADPAFVSYFFHSAEGQHKLLANASQTGVPSIARPSSYLKTIELSLPRLTEQRAIAHILGTLDDKIELNRKQNETLEAIARALFKAWFVDFEPVRAKLEGRWQHGQSLPGLPAHIYDIFPNRLVNSELGEIPEGWEGVSASRLIEFNPSEPLRKDTEAPYLEMAALPTSGSWPEPPILRPFGSGMRFRNGDTLLARITPCLENGKTAFVQCLPDNTVGWGSTEYIVMRPKAPVPPEFGYLLARDATFREQAIRSMTGTSGRQRVQADSVATFKLAAPRHEAVWDAFSRVVGPIFISIKDNAEAIATLAKLRDTLLPKLISGELRVPDAERILGA
jgi:type I restriction enzyme S subunit